MSKNNQDIDLKNILGKRIKEVREAKGLTQPELAERIGSTDRNVSNYETGYSFPSVKVLYQISVELDASIDYLLGLTNDPKVSNKQFHQLSAQDFKILDELKSEEEIYEYFAKNPKKGLKYIIKILKLMEEWKQEELEK
ncbi:helix-turn-helix transcriptional regulator [Caldifermentibacillus hisashii]|uniref:helix-turn-helix domain-containing protein n=1 Tax=Caldifermentibacillus hisashii TaxID=996558 RepID=UPI0031FBA8AF